MSQSASAFNELAVPQTDVGAPATVGRRRTQPRSLDRRAAALWALRALLVIPFVLMAPEIVAAVEGRPEAMTHLSTSTADVLGTSSFLIFVMMLCVTPVHTMTGWRWHLVLRRDYGIAMFMVAGTDLTLAAIATGDTFPGGVLARIGGHTFLVAGTVSVALLIPLVLTANRRAQRWLGGHWKSVQRITYILWVTILVHLAFLFGFSSFFVAALAVSVPLAALRVPSVRRWWRVKRRTGDSRALRLLAAAALIALFAAGFVPLAHELAIKGAAAFIQQPIN